jgi:hypothetical protein
MNETEIWNQVEGISFDGPTLKQLLDKLILGELSPHLKAELLADCSRDGDASTAGYAAIPYLIGSGFEPRLAWELAWTAGQILSDGAMHESPPVPDFLKERVGDNARNLTIQRLHSGVAFAGLNLIEQIQTVALVSSLSGRPDLAEKLTRIALIESGMPRDYVDANYPPD